MVHLQKHSLLVDRFSSFFAKYRKLVEKIIHQRKIGVNECLREETISANVLEQYRRERKLEEKKANLQCESKFTEKGKPKNYRSIYKSDRAGSFVTVPAPKVRDY